MASTFDQTTLEMLRTTKEVRLRTRRHKGQGVTIWVVVADGAVFVRSVRGPDGLWFKQVSADPKATLRVAARDLPVRATAVADPATIAAVSHAFLDKYEPSPYAKTIVRAEVLPTTLRLEPAPDAN